VAATFVTTERSDAVTLVTIDNPPMNALSSALLDELEAEIDALDADDEVRAIVLRGAGERAFVAGADIKEFPALRESAAEGGSARGIQRLGHRMDAARTPFVAAIRGFCLGGGLELAMCCDIRVCADDAKLGQPEIKLGLIPGGGLVAVAYIWTVVEVAYFTPPPAGLEGRDEAPLGLLLPTWILVLANLYFGIDAGLTSEAAGRAAAVLFGGGS
jgi:enoyl-CoA hydratase/carnithine racemase